MRALTRTALFAGLASVLLAPPAASAVKSRAGSGVHAASIGQRKVASLNNPTGFTFAPSGKIYYGERSTGEIRIFNPKTKDNHLFFKIPNVVSNGEQGLLGIALHPNWPRAPYVYAYATRNASGGERDQILKIKSKGGKGSAMQVIFSSATTSGQYHDGGRILFGPDGMLYAVQGEAHNERNAQKLSNSAGKVLRMNPNGAVPPSNPFQGSRIWSFGLRNSFGFDFDPKTKRLWETENGPGCNDELNRIVKGGNFGWGRNENCDGKSPNDTNNSGPKPRIFPKRWYTPTIAPVGAAFCQKCGLGPANSGKLFFGAYNTGDVRRVTLTNDRLGVRSQHVVFNHGNIISMETGPNGALYFSDSGGIWRLVQA